ncbi:Asp-tRNA(Asn)/Glu-tRNA(Gln) amidotransferase subunit GatB [Marinagarivorans cellulosilyticus]|uniref:Aspartyl/glutamyl-tRNA(Asn/Gln) amidotransferase subunit B n=1 Tax=Marinagarivorans cellulosilyticus TaxID=2721545 RepID=A0AAN1WHE2_9GAMM|nr:Asp-tRNA(Asn)/Glu-tRNA(Gln) amidotransferase subunit GatB [Marinagarivorans cellulosilyticus]BCD97648.1 aspartyl-tRNA(Asn)/glutamyl-tRNA(Gln) amidotransferase subunit B [Marinagarivorans cellulosilyticus]
MEWETVIGLEIHVQLATKTKIFSGSSTEFGAEPNTQACAIDLAMPGTLPVPNRQAFKYAAMFGLAIDAEIGRTSVFERKNYFYPDLPKGYQTTQLDAPIVGAGKMEIALDDGSTHTVRIHHAHLEEDAGKSLHEDFHGMSGIDLNRAGTPLIEIVTEPDMRNADQAVAFAKKLHGLVVALGICDGEMSQGSLRFDVNISIRPKGEEKLGTRTETKNLNSFKFMEEAIELEVERQISVLESGGEIRQETRLYNGDTKKARAMRSKEDSNDYRYFPCPDLLPVELSDEFLAEVKAAMPELPEDKRVRYTRDMGLSDYDAQVLTSDVATAVYFDAAVAAGAQPKLAANWVMGEIAALLNREEITIASCPVSAQALAGLTVRIDDGTINSKMAKTVFEAMAAGEGDADTIIEAKGLKQVSDSGALEKIIDEVLANNQKQVDNYRAAADDKRPKMLGFFVGQCMKASKGQANPKQLNELLVNKLNG